MQRAKLPHPLAVCDVCQALTNRREDLNHRCTRVVTGRRCYGHFKSGIGHLWDACGSCDATGAVGTQTCTACGGFGWTLYA